MAAASTASDQSLIAAVDIGGTFTDCVIVDAEGRIAYGKSLSSPTDNFQAGFFGSLRAAAQQGGYDNDELFARLTRLVSHGSTVATNIVVERKGAKVGLLTTKGHEDTLLMMRGLGRVTGEPPESILDVAHTHKPEPIVPRDHIRGITERVDSVGDVLVALDEDEVERAVRELSEQGCEAFAICFLWSIQNPAHEQRAREIVAEGRSRRVRHDLAANSPLRSASTSGRSPRSSTPTSVRAPHRYLTSLDGRLVRARLPRRPDADAVPRRDGPTRGRQGPPGHDDRLRPGRRHGRHAAAGRGLGPARRHRHRHGRHELRRRDHQGPRARDRRRDRDRQVRLQDPGGRGSLDRRGRRLDRLDRAAQRHAARRPAERELQPRAGLLRPRRHRAHGHGRRPRARLPEPGRGVRHGGRAATSTRGATWPSRPSARSPSRSACPWRTRRWASSRSSTPRWPTSSSASSSAAASTRATSPSCPTAARVRCTRRATRASWGSTESSSRARWRRSGAHSASRSRTSATSSSATSQISSPFDAAELERVYAGLEEDLRRQVAASRVEDKDPELVRYARIRYEWQRHELEIRVPVEARRRRGGRGRRPIRRDVRVPLRVGGAAARSAAGDRVRARAGLRGHRRAVDLARGPVRERQRCAHRHARRCISHAAKAASRRRSTTAPRSSPAKSSRAPRSSICPRPASSCLPARASSAPRAATSP